MSATSEVDKTIRGYLSACFAVCDDETLKQAAMELKPEITADEMAELFKYRDALREELKKENPELLNG